MATRTRRAIGGTRTDWLIRLVGLIVLLTVSTVLLPIAAVAAGIYFALAFIVAIVLDREMGANNWLMGWMRGIPRWYLKLIKWAALGDDFPGYLPSRA